jgi:hypothetical protein
MEEKLQITIFYETFLVKKDNCWIVEFISAHIYVPGMYCDIVLSVHPSHYKSLFKQQVKPSQQIVYWCMKTFKFHLLLNFPDNAL